jgi:hypothetical protein
MTHSSSAERRERKKRKWLDRRDGPRSGHENQPSQEEPARMIAEAVSTIKDEPPTVDGSGLPQLQFCPRGRESRRLATEKLRASLAAAAKVWVSRPEVAEFLNQWCRGTREAQSEASSGWTHHQIESAGESLRETFLTILEEDGLGSAKTIGGPATEISPIRGRLIEALCRATMTPGIPEDLAAGIGIMGGTGVGLRVPVLEEPRGWPQAKANRPLRKGEPIEIRWTGGEDIPRGKQIEKGAMQEQVDAEVNKEIRAGRIIEDSGVDPMAITSLSAIWKNEEKRKARLISDYRRSGVNRKIRLETTILLPGLRDIRALVSGAPRGALIAEYDIAGAFRLIQVSRHERPWLFVTDPREGKSGLLEEVCLPFGLYSSPAIICRVNAGVHRIQRRLISAEESGVYPSGLVYVDDSTWVVSNVAQLVELLMVAIACGMKIEFSKVHLSRSDARVLGFGICTDEEKGRSMFIPSDKRVKIRASIGTILEEGRIRQVSYLETLIGRLSWCAQLVRKWKRELAPLYGLLAVMKSRNIRSINLNESSKKALEFLQEELEGRCDAKISDLQTTEYVAITDACIQGLGGVICQGSHRWWFSINSTDDPEEWQRITRACKGIEVEATTGNLVSGDISYLELKAIICAVLQVERLSESNEAAIVCLSDNSAAVASITNWKSSSQGMRGLISEIDSWVGRIRAQHLPGTSNGVADRISRETRENVRMFLPGSWRELGSLRV